MQDERLIPSLVSDVVFLKRLDIDVILVHGGARQLDRRMQAAGLEPSKLDGLRVTSREVLDLANEVFLDISRVIRDAVAHRGYRGVIFDRSSGLVRSRQKDAGLGYVGEPERVDASLLDQLPAETVPIVTAITSGLEDGDPGYNVNADEVASASPVNPGGETDPDDRRGRREGRQRRVVADPDPAAGRGLYRIRRNPRRHDSQGQGLPRTPGARRQQIHIIRGDADSFINEILTDAGVGTEFVR